MPDNKMKSLQSKHKIERETYWSISIKFRDSLILRALRKYAKLKKLQEFHLISYSINLVFSLVIIHMCVI